MIVDERYTTFINSMDEPLPQDLKELYDSAIEEKIPVIRPETQCFLKTLIEIARPARLLEVGAGVGFSAMFMAHCADDGCRITTIENYAKRSESARRNIRAFGYEDKIELIAGDASDVLVSLGAGFDFVFMDAAKGQYLGFLPEIKRLVRAGGIVVSDNVLRDGDIIESRFMVERRDRTIHKRMREYLFELKRGGDFTTSIIPMGDGIALSVKKC